MKLKIIFSLLVAIGALAGLVSSGASASTGELIDLCLTAAADATLRLDAGVPAVQADSTALGWFDDGAAGFLEFGAGYADPSRPCRNFIVDIQVPADSSAPGFLPSLELTAGDVDRSDLNECPGVRTSVYRKDDPKQSSFTYLGSEDLGGKWVDGEGCVMVPWPGNNPWPVLNPPARGTATYRVVTKASQYIKCHGWCGPDGRLYLHRWVRAGHLTAIT
jgi:hypothetical protein